MTTPKNGPYSLFRMLLGVTLLSLAGCATPPGIGVHLMDSTAGLVFIGQVIQGSPADRAGIRQEDVIQSVAGIPVHSAADIEQVFARFKPGDTVSVNLWRGHSGGYRTINVALTQPEEYANNPLLPLDGWEGAEMANGKISYCPSAGRYGLSHYYFAGGDRYWIQGSVMMKTVYPPTDEPTDHGVPAWLDYITVNTTEGNQTGGFRPVSKW